MQFVERISPYLKLLFPLLILALLRASPFSNTVTEKLQEASTAQESGRHQQAAEALRQVAAREPWRVDLWERIGREAYSAGQSAEATEALQTAAARKALSADGRFLLGEAYWQQNALDEAQAAWQSLLEQGEKSTRLYDRLSQLHRKRGDFQAAVEALHDWRGAFPEDAKAAFLLGLHLSVVAPDDALPHLLDASRLDSGYTSMVQALRADLALAASADHPAYAWLLIGRSLGSIGQWDLAEEAFQKSAEVSPEYAEAWAFLGEARAHLGGSGKFELEKARGLDPESVLVKALSAVALRRQGDYASALVYLQEILKKEPQEPAWQVEIGSTVAMLGDLTEAYSYYQRAVELAPKNSQYWQGLAWFTIQYNYDIRGIGLPAARQAVLLAPNDAGALDTMGFTFAKLGDSASAERFLQRALEQDASYAPASLHLGLVYLQRQEASEAYFYLKNAAGLDSTGQVGETARRLLRDYFGEGS